MKVSTRRSQMRVTRRFDITENHPIVPMAYAVRPRKVAVDHGEIEYQWKDGAWVVDSSFSVNVSGLVLKQDGTPGQNRHSRPMPSKYDKGDTAWPWLDEIIDLLRPNGDLSMMILNEAEVG